MRVYAGRLHDLGRSGWWQALAWGFGGLLAGALIARAAPPAATADAVSAVWTLFTLAIGLAPGRAEANRYGPAPGQLSPCGDGRGVPVVRPSSFSPCLREKEVSARRRGRFRVCRRRW